jgi:hypothetical protein
MMFRTNSALHARLLRDGGAGNDPATSGGVGGGGSTTQPATDQGASGQGDDLGDTGKAVLDRERANAREHKRVADAEKARADAAEAELEKLRAANQTEAEKATAKAVKEATAAATEQGNKRLVRAEVKAAAAHAGFHDPRDAALLLADRFDQVTVDDRGQVDEDAVKTLVDELARSKPHLVKAANGSSAKPLPGQGTTPSGSVSGKDAGLAEARKRFGEPQKTT